jgi:hypothetical protein
VCSPNAIPQYTDVKEPSLLVKFCHCERSDRNSIGPQWRARAKEDGMAAHLYKRLRIGCSCHRRAAWRAAESYDLPVKFVNAVKDSREIG